jgi:hypothetical protein
MRIIFVLFLLFCGCTQRIETKKQKLEISVEKTRAIQLQRTKHFKELVGRGVIEFRWSDNRGEHKDQGDLDFWKQGDTVSLRISKLGELLMWFGGNNEQYWLFDLLGEETSLTINGHRRMFSDITMALVFLGLSPLPEGEMTIQDGIVTLVDEHHREWKMAFDSISHRPLTMKVIDGENTSSVVHRKGIGVELENVHALHWPSAGGLMDLSDSRGDTEIKIVFSSLSTVVSDEPMDRVFDLTYLEESLEPVWTLTTEE